MGTPNTPTAMPQLTVRAVILAIIYLCLPRLLFGSNYTDMRLAPYLFAIALVAIRFSPAAPRGSSRAASLPGARSPRRWPLSE